MYILDIIIFYILMVYYCNYSAESNLLTIWIAKNKKIQILFGRFIPLVFFMILHMSNCLVISQIFNIKHIRNEQTSCYENVQVIHLLIQEDTLVGMIYGYPTVVPRIRQARVAHRGGGGVQPAGL